MVKYKVISGKDFIIAKPSGETDLDASIKSIATLASITESPSDYQILLDIREANTQGNYLNRFEILAFVKELIKHRFAFQNKIAVLSRDDKQLKNCKFVELCAINRGMSVKSFISFEKAIEWISSPLEISEE